jgi:hypothetical protein
LKGTNILQCSRLIDSPLGVHSLAPALVHSEQLRGACEYYQALRDIRKTSHGAGMLNKGVKLLPLPNASSVTASGMSPAPA